MEEGWRGDGGGMEGEGDLEVEELAEGGSRTGGKGCKAHTYTVLVSK